MTTPAFLLRLMAYKPLKNVRLGPEDMECLAFANSLRAAVLEGRLRAIWCHVPNQLAGIPSKSGRTSLVRAAIARALGLIQGSSDYLFLWNGGCCAMEFKSADGRLNQGQKDFKDWCALYGVPFYVVRSADAGLAILRDHGVLA